MIQMQQLASDTLKLQVKGKLEDGDFLKIAPEVDRLSAGGTEPKLLVDVTGFEGWADMKAAKQHFSFVIHHQEKVRAIALIASEEWQHWVAGIARVFVHPEVKIFDADETVQAETWLMTQH